MSQIFTWIPADCKRALREIAILSTVKHENIVKIHDVVAPNCIDTFDDIYMVMEACDSDLDKLFHAEVMLAPNRIKKLLHTLLCGLKYLHWAGIWHRDLKPANCLLNQSARDARKNWSIKICDFGLSRAFDGEPDRADPKRLRRDLTDHVVTRFWCAPELILLEANYTEAIDMKIDLLSLTTLLNHRGLGFRVESWEPCAHQGLAAAGSLCAGCVAGHA